MSRRIEGIARDIDRAGETLQDDLRVLKNRQAVDLKCALCQFYAQRRCPIRIAARLPVDKQGSILERDPPLKFPCQLRRDDNGWPICSFFRRRNEEAEGFRNAARLTGKLF